MSGEFKAQAEIPLRVSEFAGIKKKATSGTPARNLRVFHKRLFGKPIQRNQGVHNLRFLAIIGG